MQMEAATAILAVMVTLAVMVMEIRQMGMAEHHTEGVAASEVETKCRTSVLA